MATLYGQAGGGHPATLELVGSTLRFRGKLGAFTHNARPIEHTVPLGEMDCLDLVRDHSLEKQWPAVVAFLALVGMSIWQASWQLFLTLLVFGGTMVWALSSFAAGRVLVLKTPTAHIEMRLDRRSLADAKALVAAHGRPAPSLPPAQVRPR